MWNSDCSVIGRRSVNTRENFVSNFHSKISDYMTSTTSSLKPSTSYNQETSVLSHAGLHPPRTAQTNRELAMRARRFMRPFEDN